MTAVQEVVSTFAKLVDKLRLMNEAELKLVYIRLFKEDLAKQGEKIRSEATFGDTTYEDIITAIQGARYPKDMYNIIIDANIWVRFARFRNLSPFILESHRENF